MYDSGMVTFQSEGLIQAGFSILQVDIAFTWGSNFLGGSLPGGTQNPAWTWLSRTGVANPWK